MSGLRFLGLRGHDSLRKERLEEEIVREGLLGQTQVVSGGVLLGIGLWSGDGERSPTVLKHLTDELKLLLDHMLLLLLTHTSGCISKGETFIE